MGGKEYEENSRSSVRASSVKEKEIKLNVQTGTSEPPNNDNNVAHPSADGASSVCDINKVSHLPADEASFVNEFMIKKRNLPHWQLPGSIYFITFRTYKGIILDDNSKQIIYDTILFQHKRSCVIYSFVIMPDHVHIILQPKEIENGKDVNLSKILQAIKGYSAKQIIKLIEQTGTSVPPANENIKQKVYVLPKHIFQSESYDRIIRNDEELNEKMKYVLNNPVKKGLTNDGYNYKWYFIKNE